MIDTTKRTKQQLNEQLADLIRTEPIERIKITGNVYYLISALRDRYPAVWNEWVDYYDSLPETPTRAQPLSKAYYHTGTITDKYANFEEKITQIAYKRNIRLTLDIKGDSYVAPQQCSVLTEY